MNRRFSWSLMSAGVLLAIGSSPSAHADYFSGWIATTCDAASGMAAVRFGYADADDEPLFMRGDPSVVQDLTATDPQNASQREAGCSLPNGREVKVRLGTGYSGQGDGYSVWIDKIKVLQGNIDADVDNDDLPFVVIAYPKGFRICRFKTGSQGPYNVTSVGEDAPPATIHCDAAISPIQGSPDLSEYPSTKTPQPRVGSIVVSGKKPDLCQKMVAKVGDIQPGTLDVGDYRSDQDDAIAGVRLGTVMSLEDFTQIPGFKTTDDPVASAWARVLDIFGDSHPLPVYIFSTGGTYVNEFFVVPPPEVTREGVMAVTNHVQFDDIEKRVKSLGWRVFSGQQTAFYLDAREDLELRFIQTDQGIHLLWFASRGGDQMAVLAKALSTGAIETECSFDRVAPHL